MNMCPVNIWKAYVQICYMYIFTDVCQCVQSFKPVILHLVTYNERKLSWWGICCTIFPNEVSEGRKIICKKQVAGVRSTRKRTGGWRNAVHPWSLTRNLRILHWKKKIIFQIIIFRFHVNLPGCMMGMLDDIISLFNSFFFAGWRWLKDVLNPTHLCKHLVFVESLPLEKQQIPNHQETETEWIHQTCIMHDVSVYAKKWGMH